MCIAFYTTAQIGYKLIIAANRDEFYDRASTPAAWHSFPNSTSPTHTESGPSNILSGRDISSAGGGTWIGITRDLRIGLMYVPLGQADGRTNVRDPASGAGAAIRKPGAPSRGQLLRRYLEEKDTTVQGFMDGITDVEAYDGFNLLLFQVGKEGPEVGYVSNRPKARADVVSRAEAIVGISNTPLDAPWPKVTEGQGRMEEELQSWREAGESEDQLVQRLLRILRRSIEIKTILDAPRCTCIPPVMLAGRWYGTRVSTVILVSVNDEVTFIERDIGGLSGDIGTFLTSADRVFRFKGTS